jgi:ABC-type phosphate/phosphonate transport system, periplasmic component
VAPLAKGGRFFGKTVETGGHGLSLAAVAAGEADVAAWTASPMRSSSATAPAAGEGEGALQHALGPGAALCHRRRWRSRAAVEAARRLARRHRRSRPRRRARGLLLRDVMLLPDSAYERMDEMEAAAVARGYPALG